MIHPTAIISEKAAIADGVEIGPYCVIGDHVKIAKGSKLQSHVTIEGHTDIGENNTFFPFTSIGLKTQDLKYQGGPTNLIIGDNNTFREYVSVHSSTFEHTFTKVGNNNLFLAYVHIAHECEIHNHTIFSNNASTAGHCQVFDHAILGGFAGVHQFCKIGKYAMVGGMSRIIKDVPPFTIVEGHPAAVRSLNFVGLERRGFTHEEVKALKVAYRKLFLKKNLKLEEQVSDLLIHEASSYSHVKHLIEFLSLDGRGCTR